jgi:hypothetical protein
VCPVRSFQMASWYLPSRMAAFDRGTRSYRHTALRQDFGDDMAMDIGEAPFDAVVIIGQALVVDAQEVEDGGVEVVDGGDQNRSGC